MNRQAFQAAVIDAPNLEQGKDHSTASRFLIADGTLEALKWLALTLMIADHVNKYLYKEQLPVIFQLARIVMPTFGFVLVYNLSRPGALERGVFGRVASRLTAFGALSVPICTMLNATVAPHYTWWPINILFTLLLVTAIIYLIERGGIPRKLIAGVLFVIASPFLEYAWMGVLTCLGAWYFCRRPTYKSLFGWFLGALTLTTINGNAWALLALPLLLTVSKLHIDLPRSKWLFYAVYPIHLFLILAYSRLPH